MYIQIQPTKFKEATAVFKGRKTTKKERNSGYDYEKTQDVYVYQDDKQTIIKLKAEPWYTIKGFVARLIFVFTGELWLTMHGPRLPAFAVGLGKIITTKLMKHEKSSNVTPSKRRRKNR